jgi:hypothetical protein
VGFGVARRPFRSVSGTVRRLLDDGEVRIWWQSRSGVVGGEDWTLSLLSLSVGGSCTNFEDGEGRWSERWRATSCIGRAESMLGTRRRKRDEKKELALKVKGLLLDGKKLVQD